MSASAYRILVMSFAETNRQVWTVRPDTGLTGDGKKGCKWLDAFG